jgi:hypothetical protein
MIMFILNLDPTYMLVISFTLRLFTPGERVPHIQWMGGQGDLLAGLHAVATCPETGTVKMLKD